MCCSSWRGQSCAVSEDSGKMLKANSMSQTKNVQHIVGNRPGMAGTVPDVWALSRRCLGRGKIVLSTSHRL